MIANCDRCELRGIACADCVVSVLPEGQDGIGPAERRALQVLADAGLVPPLRFSLAPAPRPADRGHSRSTRRDSRARRGLDNAKTGPSVGEAVETVLALH